jgi:general secretion pathway protein K
MRTGERGAALLTVLLLVSVMAALAASALERLRLSTRLAANAGAIEQARLYAVAAEQIATLRVTNLVEAERAPDPSWNGRVNQLPLPAGTATARIRDGGNCFNLNSVVIGQAGLPGASLTVRTAGLTQFTYLMQVLGIGENEARRVAAALADWIDTDTVAMLDGAEDAAYAARAPAYRTGNTFLADPSELRAVAGVTPDMYAKLRPFICALPTSDLSPININTVAPDQAPLVAMLFPEPVPADQVRALLAARPPGGWESGSAFWNAASRTGLVAGGEAQQQVQLRPRWFALDITVALGAARIDEQALIDARLLPARIVRRSWGEGA